MRVIQLPIAFCLFLVLQRCTQKEKTNTKKRFDSSWKATQVKIHDRILDATPDTAGNATLENKILDKISSLPEVQERQRFLDSLTNHKSGISMIIFQTPTVDSPYYWIQVGYNNRFRFEPYYNFYVYPNKRGEIKVLDPISDSITSLSDWRRKR